jgi:branched-chain amino acid transport system permease protein
MVLLQVVIFIARFVLIPCIGAIVVGAIFIHKKREAKHGLSIGQYTALMAGYIPHVVAWSNRDWDWLDRINFPLPNIIAWQSLPVTLLWWVAPLILLWVMLYFFLKPGERERSTVDNFSAALRQSYREFQWVDFIIDILRVMIIELVIIGSYNTLSAGRITGQQWGHLLMAGIAQGSIYALIALGYTLVYGILLMINFAHSEVFMAGAFSTVFLAQYFDRIEFLNSYPFLAIPLLIIFAGLISMTIAVLLERIAYRPLRNAPRLVPLITAIGASFFLQYTFRGFFGSNVRSYPDVDILQGSMDFTLRLGRTSIGLENVDRAQVFVFIFALLLMSGLYFLVERTKIGKAMRAVSENKEVAKLMGIDIDLVIMFTFALGGALAGAAGVINGLFRPQGVNAFMGFRPGIKAFTSAVLGGIGNVRGAMVGGLFLGVIEAIGPNLVLAGLGIPGANQLQDVIAFTMLVLVLIFRPQGILGERLTEKKA